MQARTSWRAIFILLSMVSSAIAYWFIQSALITRGIPLANGVIYKPPPWKNGSRLLYPDVGDCALSIRPKKTIITRHPIKRTTEVTRKNHADNEPWVLVGYQRDIPVVYRKCSGTYLVTPKLRAQIMNPP